MTLCDGALEMKSLAREVLGPSSRVDECHAMEYVREASKAACKTEPWGDTLNSKRLKNKRDTQEQLTRMQTWRMEHASEALDKCTTFFENQHEHMQYAAARKKDWIIGSGNIEATCKTVLVRFKRSGALEKQGSTTAAEGACADGLR